MNKSTMKQIVKFFGEDVVGVEMNFALRNGLECKEVIGGSNNVCIGYIVKNPDGTLTMTRNGKEMAIKLTITYNNGNIETANYRKGRGSFQDLIESMPEEVAAIKRLDSDVKSVNWKTVSVK